MNRTQKEDLVAELNETFGETTMVVVTHYSGLTVSEMSDLRGRMRESGARFKVTNPEVVLTRLGTVVGYLVVSTVLQRGFEIQSR